MTNYTMHAGSAVGKSDDEKACEANSPEEALAKAVEWADENWPDSDSRYSAAVWVERGGEVLAEQDVTISASGERID